MAKQKISLGEERKKVTPVTQVIDNNGLVKEEEVHISFNLDSNILADFKIWSARREITLSEFLRDVMKRAIENKIDMPIKKADYDKNDKIIRGFFVPKSLRIDFKTWIGETNKEYKTKVNAVDLFISEIKKVVSDQ